MLKSPLEIARIRRSVGAAVAGYRAGLQAAAAGMTEKELVAIISSTMYRSGTTAGTKPLFVNCVSGRARYPLVDSPASDNVLGDGDIVFVDGGGASDGYVSDILRLIGGPLAAADPVQPATGRAVAAEQRGQARKRRSMVARTE